VASCEKELIAKSKKDIRTNCFGISEDMIGKNSKSMVVNGNEFTSGD